MDKFTPHEKTNTWRLLKNLEPVQHWTCRIGWHRWTNWEIWTDGWSNGHPGHAQCYCSKCGMPRVEPPLTKTRKTQ